MKIFQELLSMIIVITVIYTFVSCGVDRSYETYEFSNQSITLTQSNHPHGYEQSSCFHCHVESNIHQVDQLQTGLLDLARQLTQTSGTTSCSGCHGTNGI